MNQENIKRILIYTHNSIGLGHAVRVRAVISGIRRWRPDIDFLVISGTSIPHIFFADGIEVVKLPSMKLDIDQEGTPLRPRYLRGFDLEEIVDFRQRMILDAFDFFEPDVLIIEHNMTGQMSELIPLIMKKWLRNGGARDFVLAHICRGILKWAPFLQIPYQNPRHGSGSVDVGALYDVIFVLEDREVVDVNKQYLGDDPDLERKIRYLGKITNKTHEELPTRRQALHRIGLPDKKVILISLGRNRRVFDLSQRLLKIFHDSRLNDDYQVVIVVDPYLDREAARALRNDPTNEDVRFLPFTPDLVDLMHHSDLIISRAGYNTFNEILLTGAKTILVPESHGGGEQEKRVQSLPLDNITVMTEDEIFSNGTTDRILEFLDRPVEKVSLKFDKYAIGKSILEDLETRRARHLEKDPHKP